MEEAGLPWSIHIATDGREALEILAGDGTLGRGWLPDLVLPDLHLPRLSGGELLANLRSHSGLGCIPILVLSSSVDPRDVRKSYELGANAYLAKPLDFARLQTLVRRVDRFRRLAVLPFHAELGLLVS